VASAADLCSDSEAKTGGSRRTWLLGIDKVRKRYLMSAMAHNLGIVMRRLFGMGTARSLQAEGGLAAALYSALFITVGRLRWILSRDTSVLSVPLHQPAMFFTIAEAA